jgi:hypothetical protein
LDTVFRATQNDRITGCADSRHRPMRSAIEGAQHKEHVA